MTRAKTPYVSTKTSEAKISGTSISEHIAAFEKSGGKIEVLGNTPMHSPRTLKAAAGGHDPGDKSAS